jgi:uncharacterized membrane protein
VSDSSERGRDAARWLAALGVAGGAAYPFLVYGGLRLADARVVGACVAAFVVARAALLPGGSSRRAGALAPFAVAGALGAGAVALGDARLLLFLPVLINAAFLAAFARSLRGGGPSVIERFARAHVGELSDAEVRHCRGVCQIWCGFFAANALVAAVLAVAAPLAWWTLYTGLISYLVMAALLAGEVAVRLWRFGLASVSPRARAAARAAEPGS